MKPHPLFVAFRHLPSLGAALLLSTTAAQAVLIDFNSTSDLANNFVQNQNGTGGLFSSSSSGGVNNSGSVALSSGNGTTAVYNGGSFDLTTSQSIQLSLYFRVNTTTTAGGQIALQFGIVPDTTGDLRLASPYLATRIATTTTAGTYQLLLLNLTTAGGTAGSSVLSNSFSLASGNWYQLTQTFTLTETGIAVSGSILDYGTTGTTLIGAVAGTTFSTTATNTALAGDNSIYGAFRGENGSGVSNYDNFAAVPEPSSLTLFALAIGLGVVLFRKRSALRHSTLT